MPTERSGTLAFFASHPSIGLIGTVASVAGVFLTVHYYYAALRSRKLTYYVNPATTSIVKSGRSSDLHVLFRGQPVTTDVTALQVEIWNAGKEAIHSNDILDLIVLKTSTPILEASVRRTQRDTSRFTIDSSQIANGLVGLSWRILEQDDGAIIQLIVAGDSAGVTVSGAIEGQHRIETVGTRPMFDKVIFLIIGVLGALLLSGLISSGEKPDEKEPAWVRSRRAFGRVVLSIFLIILIVGLVLVKLLVSGTLIGGASVPLAFN